MTWCTWAPIGFGADLIAEAIKPGGVDLIIPWPPGLAHSGILNLNEERDATPTERSAGRKIVERACQANDLHITNIVAACLRRQEEPRRGAVEHHLIIRIISPDTPGTHAICRPPEYWWDRDIRRINWRSKKVPVPEEREMTPQEFRAARKRLGLSANGMARALGLSDGRSIRRIEAGGTTITGPVKKLIGYLLRDADQHRGPPG